MDEQDLLAYRQRLVQFINVSAVQRPTGEASMIVSSYIRVNPEGTTRARVLNNASVSQEAGSAATEIARINTKLQRESRERETRDRQDNVDREVTDARRTAVKQGERQPSSVSDFYARLVQLARDSDENYTNPEWMEMATRFVRDMEASGMMERVVRYGLQNNRYRDDFTFERR
jgi:DNA topoisomerase VI subunit B